MPLDDPTLLVNVLTRDLRAMTQERDELLHNLQILQESTPPLTRIQELESTITSLQCTLLETESELKQTRETAYTRLNENVELRNRRARVKRDLQTVTTKLNDAENAMKEMEKKHEEELKEMEKRLLGARDDLVAERRKNAGLKDLIVRVTSQRDDALAKLSGTPRPPSAMSDSSSMITSPPRRATQRQFGSYSNLSTIDEFGQPPTSDMQSSPGAAKRASLRKHAELSDALVTPLERNTFETTDMMIQSPPRVNALRQQHPPSSPSGRSDYSMMDEDYADFKSRSRRLTALKKLPAIDIPEEAVAYPVCAGTDDLDAKLKVLAKSHIFNTPHSLPSTHVEFANPARQHGYILRPTLVLDAEQNRWEPYTIETLEEGFPQIFELFVRLEGDEGGWFYKGTYRRAGVQLGNLTVGEWEDLDSETKARLLDQVFHFSPHQRQRFQDPFASGDVHAQCVGLQCIGFNASLYHALDQFTHFGQRSQSVYPASGATTVVGFNTPIFPPSSSASAFNTPTLDKPKSGWDPTSPEFEVEFAFNSGEGANGAGAGGWGAKALMRRLSNTWSGHKRIRSLDVGKDDDAESDAGSTTFGVGKRVKLGRANSRLRFTES